MNAIIVIGVLALLTFLLIWKSGKVYPSLYLLLFTFFLQYIFSTYFVYNEYKELRVQMPISQEELFAYAVPAICFFFLGIFIFNKDIDVRDLLIKIDPKRAARFGYLLLLISFTFDFIKFVGYSGFDSIISFTSYLKYLAVFCFLFSNSWILYFVSVLIYVQLIAQVLRTGVFIDFITWCTFLFFFICLRFKLSFYMRALVFLGAIPVLITIQGVKDEYRHATWPSSQEGGIGLFSELVEKKSRENTGEPFEQSEGVVRTIGRLSQGWHLGLVLRRVPVKQPFANGQEMLSDIGSSLLPRFLFEDKKIVHTKEKFFKYTGHKLGKHTAMTIGIFGDFFINYGWYGSFIMLFLFGVLIAKYTRTFITRYVVPDPINIIWLPFLLSYLIRADNDFYIFINCLVKGFGIFFVVNYFRIHYMEPKRTNQLMPS
jgi:hypothetical protein